MRNVLGRAIAPATATAVLAVVCGAVVSSAAANGSSRDRCASPESRTITANEHVRVFVKRRPSAKAGRYYGCSRQSGRKTLLSQEPSGESFYGVGRFRVAGTLVAYERVKITGISRSSNAERRIFVRDLRTARIVRRLDPGEFRGAAFAEPEPKDGVRDLVLSSKGDVAWIVQNPFAVTPPEPNVNTSSRSTEVYAAPRGESPTLLDQGDAVTQTSLTRTGCLIFWRNGTADRSASVCPQR